MHEFYSFNLQPETSRIVVCLVPVSEQLVGHLSSFDDQQIFRQCKIGSSSSGLFVLCDEALEASSALNGQLTQSV